MKKYILPTLIALFAAGSCSTSFDPDIESKQEGVLNVVVTADEPVKTYVSTTWRYNRPEQFRELIDAEVSLYVNGVEIEQLKYDEDEEAYLSHFEPVEGDRVEVSAATKDFGILSGSAVVPDRIEIEDYSFISSSYEDKQSMWYYDGQYGYASAVAIDYKIEFTDPAAEENYYMLSGTVYPTDPIFDENQSPIDGVIDSDTYSYYNIFSDRSINGRTYSLQCRSVYHFSQFDNMRPDRQEYIDRIYLVSISKDYYRYLMSILKKENGLQGTLDEIGLSSPATIFSNIDGGVGIVAAQAVTKLELDVTDIVESYK